MKMTEDLRKARELLKKMKMGNCVLSTDEVQQRLTPLIAKFMSFFSMEEIDGQDNMSLRPPNTTSYVQHRIRSKEGAEPYASKPYRVFGEKRTFIEDKIRELLKKGVIRPSVSPWASPVVLVDKPNGTFRFCVNYKRVNQTTERDSYAIPRVDDTCEALDGSAIFTTIDISSAYTSMPMFPDDIPKTAMISHMGLF